MRIDIVGQGRNISPTLQAYVQQRLRCALSRFNGRISRAQVRIIALQRASQRAESLCRITVGMAHAPQVRVEDSAPDVYVAIDRAVDRAERVIRRWLERQRDLVTGPSVAGGSGRAGRH